MKNLFGYKLNEAAYDGDAFLVCRGVEGELASKREQMLKEQATFNRAASLPAWVNVCGVILLFLGLIILCGFLEALEAMSFAEAWNNAGWCLITGAVALALGAVIMIVAVVKIKRAKESPAYRFLQEKTQKLQKECYEFFKVPASAQTIDVFTTSYTAKPGKEFKERAWSRAYSHTEVMIYRENDELRFALTDCVFSIPLSRIVRIQCIGKRIAAKNWNKGDVRKSIWTGKFVYNNCKVLVGNNGLYTTKPYYRVVVRDDNYEEFAILVPCYEIETVLSVTGKNVE